MTPEYLRLLSPIVNALRPEKRPIIQFAKEEIIIPDGLFRDTYYDPKLLPYSEAYLKEVESGNYSSYAICGPSQAGKTLTGILIPLLYYLFEEREYVMFGLPSGAMVRDKLLRDIFPIIHKSRYAKFIPTKGQGSKGGLTDYVAFTNGAALRALTAGGNEKGRAGLTGRLLIADEIDGYADASRANEETDRLSQMVARTRAYISARQIYMASTPTTPQGRIWTEVNVHGTGSRLLIRCQHCSKYVLPERKHLTGWENADSEEQAREQATMVCPECGVCWTEEDRVQANRDYRLEHTRASRQLGFQFTATHNLLYTIKDIAAEEWRASKRPDKDLAERELTQFVWGIPFEPPKPEDQINIESLQYAISPSLQRTIVPKDFSFVTVGVDTHQWGLVWVATAWKDDYTSHVINYGIADVNSEFLGIEKGIKCAVEELNDQFAQGYIREGSSEVITPSVVLMDAGWETNVVCLLCKSFNWIPAKGSGDPNQFGAKSTYRHPTSTNHRIVWIGDQQNLVMHPTQTLLLERDASHEKSRLLNFMSIPEGEAGHWGLFSASKKEHARFLRAMASEILTDIDGTLKWVRLSSNNHYRDAWLLSYSAARMKIQRELEAKTQKPKFVITS